MSIGCVSGMWRFCGASERARVLCIDWLCVGDVAILWSERVQCESMGCVLGGFIEFLFLVSFFCG